MKKGWKIALISLISLIGLVVVAVAVVCWLVFTPEKLTGIVNKLSKEVVTCDAHFESVNLTLFKTFPYAGLEIHDVILVNPIQGAVSDTLATIDELTVAINAKAFITKGDILVKQVLLDNAFADLYVSPDGTSNYDIFPPSEDTTDNEPSKLPDYIDVEKIKINNLHVSYDDYKQGIFAAANDFNLDLKGNWKDETADAKLSIACNAIRFSQKDSNGVETLYANFHDLDANLRGKIKDKEGNADLKLKSCDVDFRLRDGSNKETMATKLDRLNIKLNGTGSLDAMDGKLVLNIPQGDVNVAGIDYITPRMKEQKKDVLTLTAPFKANINDLSFTLQEAQLSLAQWNIDVDGDVALAKDGRDMSVNVSFATNKWGAEELLQVLPAQFTTWKKGMNLDANLEARGSAVGFVNDSTFPLIVANVVLKDGKFSYPKAIPYKVERISADVDATLNLSKNGISNVTINKCDAYTGKDHVQLTGSVRDLLGEQDVDANLKADVLLPDLKPLLEKVPVDPKGRADVSLHLRGLLSNITAMKLEKLKADGSIKIKNMDVTYDSIHAKSPQFDIALHLPAKKRSTKVNEVLTAHITSNTLNVELPNNKIATDVKGADIEVGLSNVLDSKKPIAAAFDIAFASVGATLDTLPINTDRLALKGSIKYDSTKANILKQLNPNLDIDLQNGRIKVPGSDHQLFMPVFDFNYQPEVCQIKELVLHFGMSDYHLDGKVSGLEDWLDHKAMLKGQMNFNSDYTDLDQLLDLISGIGTDSDTLERQKQEDNVAKAANPFIVPKDVDFRLNTHIKHTSAFGNELSSVGGGVTIKDGVAVVDQMGFVCKAAKMQLTAIYKSPRPNNLFLGLDFHLIDIQIAELIDMIPYVDTIVPMLASFNGNADFHLAAETYLNAYYKPKLSTLLGAAAITGKDLVVLDNDTFDQIAKLLMFKKSTVNKIDSLDVEVTVFDREAEVYPFVVSMDKYQVCASGRHTLDNAYNYHLEILKSPLPTRIGVDVSGVLPKLNFKLGKVKYAELYNPEKQNAVQHRTMALKNLIRQSLEGNVREETKRAKAE